MAHKSYKPLPNAVRPLATGHGGCFASDKITVEGMPVGYMVRNHDDRLSGWSFLSGTESQSYLDDPNNVGIFDVNTIANYDPDIVPFLHAPPGCAFERRSPKSPLVPCPGSEDWKTRQLQPGKHWPPPGFPLVDRGTFPLTKQWKLSLPSQFARRIEDGSLVLWRPGLTLWIAAFHNDHHTSQAQRMRELSQDRFPAAVDVVESSSHGVTRMRYRLVEDGVHSLTALTVADHGHLLVSIYFDDPNDAPTAIDIADSIALRD